MTKYMIENQFSAPIFLEFMDTKNGIPATLQQCVTETQIDSALVELQPLSKQLMYEFYDFSVASTLPDFVTTKQSKQDLIDVIELDCATLQLESDPKAVINLWISQSAAT